MAHLGGKRVRSTTMLQKLNKNFSYGESIQYTSEDDVKFLEDSKYLNAWLLRKTFVACLIALGV